MKAYPAYKDSGVEWIGNIPQDWDITKLKWLLKDKLKYGANESAELVDKTLPRYIRITDFDESGNIRENTFRSLPNEIAQDYLLDEGDILFARSGATVGKTFQFKNYKGKACFAGYLIKASPNTKKVLSDYLYLFTKSSSYEYWKNSIFIQATIQNIGANKYQYLDVPVPPLSKQRAIADFLDAKTAQIDELIDKKQRQIELLQEHRIAIINQAVTKGLNPDAPMKDSGIEWMGEVPTHWGIKRLGWITSLITDIDHKMPTAIEDGIPFLSAKDLLDDGTLNFGDDVKNISKEDFRRLSRKVQPKRNDIIFSRIGTVGKARFVETDESFLVSYSCCVVRVIEKVAIPEYICFILDSETVLTEAKARTVGIGVPDLGLAEIARFSIPVPPKVEQQQILDFLKTQVGQIRLAEQKAAYQIELLQEYRTALIFAAVTGKIDVRI